MMRTILLLCSVLLCFERTVALGTAATYVVNSESIPLNVRSGPGIEYSVQTRLLHGTQVTIVERAGLWAKILLLNSSTAGWVLERYLMPIPASAPEAPPTTQAELSPEQEQRRFDRLQRKGVITAQRLGDTEMLRLTLNPLLWARLTANEQRNFLQRAKQLFGGTVVEVYDPHTNVLFARLPATGALESIPPPSLTPSVPGEPATRPAAPAAAKTQRSAQPSATTGARNPRR